MIDDFGVQESLVLPQDVFYIAKLATYLRVRSLFSDRLFKLFELPQSTEFGKRYHRWINELQEINLDLLSHQIRLLDACLVIIVYVSEN